MRVPMPAAACESSPAWGVSCGGDFALGKMSGCVDLPHRRSGPPPHSWLYSAHPYQPPGAPTGMCSTGWELPVEEAAPPPPPLVHRGPQLWRGHRHPWVQDCCWQPLEGIMWSIQPSYRAVCAASLPFPGTDTCYGNTHIAFSSFTPIQGGELTSALGKGQASWCQCGLGCPSSAQDLPKPPRCLSASPACHNVPVQQLRAAGHGWRIFSEARG